MSDAVGSVESDAAAEAAREHNARAERAQKRPAAAEQPAAAPAAAKPAPCPCQEPGAVTLEQVDQRVAALARLIVIAIAAAATIYILAGRKSDEE